MGNKNKNLENKLENFALKQNNLATYTLAGPAISYVIIKLCYDFITDSALRETMIKTIEYIPKTIF